MRGVRSMEKGGKNESNMAGRKSSISRHFLVFPPLSSSVVSTVTVDTGKTGKGLARESRQRVVERGELDERRKCEEDCADYLCSRER